MPQVPIFVHEMEMDFLLIMISSRRRFLYDRWRFKYRGQVGFTTFLMWDSMLSKYYKRVDFLAKVILRGGHRKKRLDEDVDNIYR